MKQNNLNTNAFLIHICGFGNIIFPLGSIIIPFVSWQTLKNRSPELDKHGKEAINFNLTFTFYIFLAGLISNAVFDINYFDFNYTLATKLLNLVTIVGFINIIKISLTIIAAKKAKEGKMYEYPFTIKFIE